MKGWLVALLCLTLAACASAPTSAPTGLFSDTLFKPSSEPISADDVFALSPEMRQYLGSDIAPLLRSRGSRAPACSSSSTTRR